MRLPSAPDEFLEPSQVEDADPIPNQTSSDEAVDTIEVLGDFADIVSDLFSTWVSDGEERWAAQAYLSLKRQGLVVDGDGVDHVRNGVMLCAIWAISREFYVRAFEEGSQGDWMYEAPDVIGDFPKLSPLNLGRLAEREGLSVDTDEGDESARDVLRELIRTSAPAVVTALRSDLSDTFLFPYMWAIPSEDVTYPLPDDHDAWGLLHHPTYSALDAWGWIEDGMPL